MPVLEPLHADVAEPTNLVNAIRKRRGGRLLKLDRMLLHSPAFAEGWNSHLAKVRLELTLDGQLRELAICVVAVMNQADYELEQHLPVYQSLGGSDEKCAALLDLKSRDTTPAVFSPVEADVVDIARQMTVRVEVQTELKARLLTELGPQKYVELIGVIATYNMVSRFLVALDLHAE